MLKFRDKEYDFDIYDADQAELYYTELEKVRETSKAAGGESGPAFIRQACAAVFAFFDAVLGEGAHKEIFGERTNLRVCLEVFGEFTAAVAAQKDALDAVAAKYAPGRAQRRAEK